MKNFWVCFDWNKRTSGPLECFWIRNKRSEFRYMHLFNDSILQYFVFSHSNTKTVLYLFCEHCCVNMLSATNPQFCGAYCRGLLFPTVINEIPVLFLWYVANLLARWLLHILKKMVLFTETLLFGDFTLISEEPDMIFVQNSTQPDFQFYTSFTPQKCVICDIFSQINSVNASNINNLGIG